MRARRSLSRVVGPLLALLVVTAGCRQVREIVVPAPRCDTVASCADRGTLRVRANTATTALGPRCARSPVALACSTSTLGQAFDVALPADTLVDVETDLPGAAFELREGTCAAAARLCSAEPVTRFVSGPAPSRATVVVATGTSTAIGGLRVVFDPHRTCARARALEVDTSPLRLSARTSTRPTLEPWNCRPGPNLERHFYTVTLERASELVVEATSSSDESLIVALGADCARVDASCFAGARQVSVRRNLEAGTWRLAVGGAAASRGYALSVRALPPSAALVFPDFGDTPGPSLAQPRDVIAGTRTTTVTALVAVELDLRVDAPSDSATRLQLYVERQPLAPFDVPAGATQVRLRRAVTPPLALTGSVRLELELVGAAPSRPLGVPFGVSSLRLVGAE